MMAEQPYPPPPPAAVTTRGGFHGPETNFFKGLRARLSSLEKVFPPSIQLNLKGGLLVSLVFAASVGILLSLLVQLPLNEPLGFATIYVLVAPLSEELFKAVGIVIVASFMWKVIPNRRYGAALGAAAGLGFAVVENIIYITGQGGEQAIRFLLLPFMHPVFSAFVGVGVFAFFADKQDLERKVALPLIFLGLGLLNHIVWNSISLLGVVGILVNVFLTFPIFALILRDLLGGHFNFWNFFEPVHDADQQVSPIVPPPPP